MVLPFFRELGGLCIVCGDDYHGSIIAMRRGYWRWVHLERYFTKVPVRVVQEDMRSVRVNQTIHR